MAGGRLAVLHIQIENEEAVLVGLQRIREVMKEIIIVKDLR